MWGGQTNVASYAFTQDRDSSCALLTIRCDGTDDWTFAFRPVALEVGVLSAMGAQPWTTPAGTQRIISTTDVAKQLTLSDVGTYA